MLCSKNLHEIRGPLDRASNGECIHCARARGRKHSAARTEALKVCRDLEDAGIPADADEIEKLIAERWIDQTYTVNRYE